MKSIMTSVMLGVAWNICAAADAGYLSTLNGFEVERMPFGSGTPAVHMTSGTETADAVVDGLYHVPNYLPGFPTAATIWPREIPLDCAPDPVTGKPSCSGYQVIPAVGRGEYLFVRPMVKVVAPPPEPRVAEPPPPEEPLPVTSKKPLG